MFKKIAILIILTSSIYFTAFTQKQVTDLVFEKFNEAKTLVDSGKYELANIQFLKLLSPSIVLPDELCFYFGKSLFHTGYPIQCESFLKKFLDLKGKKTVYQEEIEEILRELNPKLSSENSLKDVNSNKKIELDHSLCGGNEYITCPICNGTKVRVEDGDFGQIYKTCHYCNEHGQMSCEDYNTYLNGELKK